MEPDVNAEHEVVVVRHLGPDSRPSWSDVTSAGIFTVEPDGRFDRHYHDCDEYWLFFRGRGIVSVGDELFSVEAGDIVCTRAGIEHDVVEVADTLAGFWFEGATPPDGRIGHLHRNSEAAQGHTVPRMREPKSSASAAQ
jgi:mannose-6-phosphate isomerase-like protein (cupin superfamily)